MRRAALAFALLAGCGPIQRTASQHGEDLFASTSLGDEKLSFSCATCHEGAAPRQGVTLPGAPLRGATERPSYWGGAELDLLRSINHCLVDLMERDDGLAADDEEARALWGYLASLSDGTGEDPVPFTIPAVPVDPGAGDAQAGEGVYVAACAQCHGDAHSGAGRLTTRAPILPEDTLAQHPPPEYTDEERRYVFVQKTRHGAYYGYGGSMPPFSPEVLSDEALADLLAALGL